MTNTRPKGSLPVLAYLSSWPLSMLCYMRVFQKDDKLLSIALYVPVTLHGAEEEHFCVLQYDADNHQNRCLAALNSLRVHIPNDRLQEFARHAEPETTTMTLTLKQPAPIWCPLGQHMAPQAIPASVTAFAELVELVKATVVHLVYDSKWLNKAGQDTIQRLTKGKVSFKGFPLDKHYSKNWEVKDWTHFAPSITPAIPPKATNKRARPVSGSISPEPPAKRAIVDDPDPPSPTEVASSPPEYVKPHSEADFQTRAISHVVVRELPAVLAAVLPAYLPTIFAAPALHTNSFDSDDSTLPKMKLTTAGEALVPHLLAHLHPQLQDIQDRALSRATRTDRDKADLEFREEVESNKQELHEITEDGKEDLVKAVAEGTDDFRHQLKEEGDDYAVDVHEQVKQAADDVVDDTMKRLREIDRQALGRMIEWELARQSERTVGRSESGLRGVRKGKGGCRAAGRRERTSGETLDAWQSRNQRAGNQLSWRL